MSDRKRSLQVDEDDSVALLHDVFLALHGDASKNVFTIGGSLRNPHDAGTAYHDSIVIRWDSGEGFGCKTSLPVGSDEVSSCAFQQLLEDCQPATFGRGTQVVLDEAYRKAGKMDVTEFCTNFHPAEHGVIDTVTQALVQSRSSDDAYNLNVGSLQRRERCYS